MEKMKLKDGINLFMIKDEKFKSFRASVIIHRPLDKKEVTLNTLTAAVLRMQSENFPSAQEISEELELLYGGDLIARAGKYGERQLIKIGVQTVSDKALGEEGNFERAMNLLSDIVFRAGTGNSFSKNVTELEKKNIKDAILAQKNDKRSYSVLRLQEEMCKDEPYGINSLGYIEDLEKITPEELYCHYKKILKESRIDIVFTGNFDCRKAEQAGKEFVDSLKGREGEKISEKYCAQKGEVKVITDKMDITQGKMCLGFRSAEGSSREKYPAMVVYNSIFGGSAVSKLFENVREKLSLCYYVGSSIDRLKEIMVVRSGVDTENFSVAYDEILRQQELMKNGDFTDNEIDFAKKQIVNAYNSAYDSISSVEEFYIMQLILGTDESIDSMCRKISEVTREEITEAANSMVLDTVYYMDRVTESFCHP